MPVIREYRSQVAAPTGESRAYSDPGAAARAGFGLAQVGQALSQTGDLLHKLQEQDDQSTLQAETAKARADLTDALTQSVQDGSVSDKEFSTKFGEQVAARTAGIQDKMQTRNGRNTARGYTADLSAQFQTQAYHAQAIAAGNKAVQNYNTALDADQRTLGNDPTQFQFVVKALVSALNDPNGAYANIPAEKRKELLDATQQKLALSAMQGTIRNISPEYAKQQLANGEGPAALLSPEAQQAMLNMADTHIRAREVEDARLEAQKEKAKRDAQEATMESFVAKMHTPNGNTLTTKEVLNSGLTAGQQEHFLNMMDEVSHGRAADNPATMNEIFRLIHLPSSDPRKITSEEQLYARFGKGMGPSGLELARREIKADPFGQDVHESMQTLERMTSRSFMGQMQPDLAAEATYRIRGDLAKAIDKWKADGKDPRDLITPPSEGHPNPDYWLTKGRIDTYMKKATGLIASQADAAVNEARVVAEKAKTAKIGDTVVFGGKTYKLDGNRVWQPYEGK